MDGSGCTSAWVYFIAVVLSLLALPAASAIPSPISCWTRCYPTVFIADLFRMPRVWVRVEVAPSRCIAFDGNDALIGDIASIIFSDLAMCCLMVKRSGSMNRYH